MALIVSAVAVVGSVALAVVADDPEYVISGSGSTAAPLTVDDFLRIYVDDNLVAEVIGDCRIDCRAPSVRFRAKPGAQLRVDAFDRGDSYRLGAVSIHKADRLLRELTPGVPPCSLAARPCPTPAVPEGVLFFGERYVLP